MNIIIVFVNRKIQQLTPIIVASQDFRVEFAYPERSQEYKTVFVLRYKKRKENDDAMYNITVASRQRLFGRGNPSLLLN